MPTYPYRYLDTHGPSTADDMNPYPGGVSTESKEEGVTKFYPGVSRGASDTVTGPVRAVYYIDGEHDPETVINAWLDANPRLLEADAIRAVIIAVNSHGSEFADVSKEVLRDRYGREVWYDEFTPDGTNTDAETPDKSIHDALVAMNPEDL